MTMQYSAFEISEVTHTKASPLEYFGFIVAALNEAVCPRAIHGIQYLMKPITVCSCAVAELRQIHYLDGQQPVCQPL